MITKSKNEGFLREKSLILIIEDDADLSDTLSEVAKSCNYDVVQAGNGKDAIELFTDDNFRPVLVLCDLKMPVMGGLEFIRQAIVRNLDVSICLLSGNDERSDIIQGLQLGVIDYLSKPISLNILKEKLKLMVDIGKRAKKIRHYLKGNVDMNNSMKLNNLLKMKNCG